MQSITVKAVGPVSSLLETSETVVTCDSPLPVSVILDELRIRYPLFSKFLGQLDVEDNLMIRCGGREMQFDSMVQPGEELLLLTPISGG
jgi:hypothetical protein